MTDQELLTLAAKAAGINLSSYEWRDDSYFARGKYEDTVVWDPLTDDGDALRLAVKLNIHVLRFDGMTTARPLLADWACDERDDGDADAATRRAIVRAAAEIGRSVA